MSGAQTVYRFDGGSDLSRAQRCSLPHRAREDWNAVRFALEKGGKKTGGLSLDVGQFGGEFGEDFYDAVTLQATLDCHDVVGGTATDRKMALAEPGARGCIEDGRTGGG